MKQTARLLRSILGQAVDDGRLARNAVAQVKQPSVRPGRQLFLNADELEDLAGEFGEYGPLVWFLGSPGLRFGEAVALRPGRVDQKRRRVRVEEAATIWYAPLPAAGPCVTATSVVGCSPPLRSGSVSRTSSRTI